MTAVLLTILVAVEARGSGRTRAGWVGLTVLTFTCATGIAVLTRLIS